MRFVTRCTKVFPRFFINYLFSVQIGVFLSRLLRFECVIVTTCIVFFVERDVWVDLYGFSMARAGEEKDAGRVIGRECRQEKAGI